MKKILFVVHALNVGGVSSVLRSITDLLIDRGYEITVAVTSDVVTDIGLNPTVKVKHKDEPKRVYLKHIPYFKYRLESGYWSVHRSSRELYQFFVGTDEKYDVEIAFFCGRPTKVILGSPNRESVKIQWVHTDYTKSTVYKACYKTEAEAIMANNTFDYICCCGDNARLAYIKTIGRDKNVISIPNMVDETIIRKLSTEITPTKTEEITFVNVSRFSEEKGLMRLLSVCKKLNSEGYNFCLWLVGDGPQRVEIEQYVDENEMNYVKLFGMQKNPYPYIRAADCYACASYLEGFGISLYEAAVLGKPVVSTDVCGARELIEDDRYGILCENSEDGLYSGLKRMLNGYNLAEYQKRMSGWVNPINGAKIADIIENVFNRAE